MSASPSRVFRWSRRTKAKCTREQYLAYLRAIVEQFDLKINTYEPVMNIQRVGDEFILDHPAGG